MHVICHTIYSITPRQELFFNQILTVSIRLADQQALSIYLSPLSLIVGVTGTQSCAQLFMWVLGTSSESLFSLFFLVLYLAGLVAWPVHTRGSSCCHLPASTGVVHHHLSFIIWVLGIELRFSCLTANSVPAEPPPQPVSKCLTFWCNDSYKYVGLHCNYGSSCGCGLQVRHTL